MKTLKSERLLLRSWVKEDVNDLFDYAKLDTVGPFAGWKPHESIAESMEVIDKFIVSDDVWAIELKETRKVIGSIGLHQRISVQGEIVYEMGYVLSTPYEGKGLMTEAVKKVMAYAFLEKDIALIKVAHFLGNDKSRRVIEKCGFVYEKDGSHQSHAYGPKLSKVYFLTQSQYIKNGGINMYTWDLSPLYKGFEDELYLHDLKKFDLFIEELVKEESSLDSTENAEVKLVHFLRKEIEFNTLADRLIVFISLTEATDSTNQVAIKALNHLQNKFTELTKLGTLFKKWLVQVKDLDQIIEHNAFLKEHEFYIKENRTYATHLLDDKSEILISKLRQTGSTSWTRLQSLLTSTVAVNYDGKEITLSEVRNLAYEKDAEVRKNAYFAELAAYKKIEQSISFSLNSIKGEVNTLSEIRGFASPLDQALEQSRMKRATLDVMISTMEEYLPIFRQYLKRKGELLGHKNGLPFYDLFAPIGSVDKSFTVEEANLYILQNFKTFSNRLYEMANTAFKDHWVDYYPKKGKVGGAFCANIHSIKASRVLHNFTGVFGDVITLAHELGHAYHGEAIFTESLLNAEYTMPVAETASTFCETIVNKAALGDASTVEEKIYLLESSIQDYTQVIVDIMSRFLFEKSVFEGRKETVFDENELKEMMLDAQKKTYGDGLDNEFLHPYMWACKSHYYSGSLSYYNFPYAFGLLFAKGLYAKYLQNKETFVPLYDKLLSATGKNTVEDAAMIAGIDVTDKAFWKGSLDLIKEDIDLFLELTK
ncbi:MAG: GNAT family N-acetyltransferase [Candidatus Izemoplasmatales bacterium]|nr:GNAT family N-acetyltransferase [Candidatus Izemoplasmatales bacterium]